MGEIADAMIEGDLSEDGEYIGVYEAVEPGRKKYNLTREQAIRIIDLACAKDDPHWAFCTNELYDETTDSMPSIYDVLRAIGVSAAEFDKATGIAL